MRRCLVSTGTVQLDETSSHLPNDTRYQELVAEAARAFSAESGQSLVAPSEVESLLRRSWDKVTEFVRRGRPQDEAVARAVKEALADRPVGRPGAADRLSFKPNVPSKNTLRFVAEAIRRDLEGDRRRLALLQLRLVQQVALARLGDQPESSVELDQAQRLRKLVTDLNHPLGLLPEVEELLLKVP